ncbi:hypothetical protein BJ875DRAFT_462810 [Amylocarpus encephaloides]|uniref:J domain-containing protein n=1 Tax=Amylocarpus encephaloides TaxID=45428 RepID=A0A9P8C4W7_9HELO|nr:hypothetical protein BJ875DRAFT_462810 [Amylocarpus encephaloides]
MTSHVRCDPVAGVPDKSTRNEDEAPRTSKFRFKSRKRSHDGEWRQRADDLAQDRHHRRHHHRSKRRRSSPSAAPKDDPSLYDDTYLPNTSSDQYVDPDVAFRESLFDAMADDEGAAYWEGVYGQPIHMYPDVKEGPAGELERMTDEEYAAHVRAKMFEKTHQHLIEEKSRREAAKKERARLAEEGKQQEKEAKRFQRKVEESLRRGKERKNRKSWGDRWEEYIKEWDDLGQRKDTKVAIASIPWPVESGRKIDLDFREMERFFLYAPTSGQPTESDLGKVLKLERIRWHPDKIQQKLGGQDVSEDVLQAVTMVFQFIDRMWSEMRDGKR